jgi:alkylated DNA repair dioxygenase AlkB
MSPRQLGLFETLPGLPEGLVYRPDFVSAGEEAELVRHVAGLDFREFEFHGYFGKRRVVSFGLTYDFADNALHKAPAIPDFLGPIRDRAARFAGVAEAAFEQALVLEYPPGAGIGWHRDRPVYREIVGVSLLSPCRFRLRRRRGAGWERAEFAPMPRSAYLLRGPVRTDWQHSIPPGDRLRYSITFRSLA